MIVRIRYWVHSYEKVLGYKEGEDISVTLEILQILSTRYDIALMNRILENKSTITYLAIDEKGKRFTQR